MELEAIAPARVGARNRGEIQIHRGAIQDGVQT
jgi:hypothetical protein